MAEKGPFARFPEANVNSQVASPKLPKPGSKRLLARICVAQKGPFARFPEANFNAQLASPKEPKSEKYDARVKP